VGGDRTDAIWRYSQPPAIGSGQAPFHLSPDKRRPVMILWALVHTSASRRDVPEPIRQLELNLLHTLEQASCLGCGVPNVSWSWGRGHPANALDRNCQHQLKAN